MLTTATSFSIGLELTAFPNEAVPPVKTGVQQASISLLPSSACMTYRNKVFHLPSSLGFLAAPLVRPGELSYTVCLMCLAVPALITKIDGVMADAELAGNQTSVNILFTPEAKVGDYVIMHAGYAISVMNSAEAEETFQLLEEMAGLDAEE